MTPEFASGLHLRCSYTAPQLRSATPLQAVGAGGAEGSPNTYLMAKASHTTPAAPAH